MTPIVRSQSIVWQEVLIFQAFEVPFHWAFQRHGVIIMVGAGSPKPAYPQALMSSDESVFTRLIARVTALLPQGWQGHAGRLFRKGTQALSTFAEENRLLPQDLAHDGIELGRRKLTGLASQEHAAAEKNYAEAAMAFTESEDKKIETELKKRSLESEVRKKEAEAREANARASLAETEALTAQLELHHKLNDAGMMLRRDERGGLTISPKPNDQEPLQLE